jgi:hypothetical protein
MPIWLRRYTFNNIKEYYDEQAKNNKPKQQSTNKILKPGIAANYTSKASK